MKSTAKHIEKYRWLYTCKILGVFLGATSIMIGQMPIIIAQFSGMTVIGTHVGYLLGALTAAWIGWHSWRKSLAASLLTMAMANITYYGCILVFYFTGWGRSPFPPPPFQVLLSLIQWTIISAIVCVLAATAVWMARRAQSKWLNYGIFAVSYVGILGVIYYYSIAPTISWFSALQTAGAFNGLHLAGRLLEIGLALVITTVVLGIGLITRLKVDRETGA